MSKILCDCEINERLGSFLIEYEAIKLGLKTKRISHSLLIVSDSNGTEKLFRRAGNAGVSYPAELVTMNKDLTKRILYDAGIPVAPWIAIKENELDKAERFCIQQKWQVVVKPTCGAGGRAVSTDINNTNELSLAIKNAATARVSSTKYLAPYKIIIEKKISARDYRFFLVNNKVCAIADRLRPSIEGDGESTIKTLIEMKQSKRRQNPDLRFRLILVDDHLQDRITSLGYTMDSILPLGKKIEIRGNGNISTGGETIDITESVAPEIIKLVERASKAIPDIQVCAMDVLCYDIKSQDVSEKNLVVNEIETDPGMSIHHFPYSGAPRNLARKILQYLFNLPEDPPSQIYVHDFEENKDLVLKIVKSMNENYFSYFDDRFGVV